MGFWNAVKNVAQATFDIGAIVAVETTHHLNKSSGSIESITTKLVANAANLKAKHHQTIVNREADVKKATVVTNPQQVEDAVIINN